MVVEKKEKEVTAELALAGHEVTDPARAADDAAAHAIQLGRRRRSVIVDDGVWPIQERYLERVMELYKPSQKGIYK